MQRGAGGNVPEHFAKFGLITSGGVTCERVTTCQPGLGQLAVDPS